MAERERTNRTRARRPLAPATLALLAAVAAASTAHAPADAQSSLQDRMLAPSADVALLTAKDPEALRIIAAKFGVAELRRDQTGAPFIIGSIDGLNYGIFFYGCSEGAECQDLQFAAAFSGASGGDAEFGRWNQQNRYGKALAGATGAPQVVMDVNLTAGVTPANFERTVALWRDQMISFRDYLRSL